MVLSRSLSAWRTLASVFSGRWPAAPGRRALRVAAHGCTAARLRSARRVASAAPRSGARTPRSGSRLTVAPPLAGAMQLAFRPFLLFSAIGALLWAALPVLLGAVFRTEVAWALERLSALGSGALLVIGGLVLFYAGIKAFERYLFLRMMRAVRITVPELRELLQNGTPPVVIDVRSATMRRLDPRQIPGAIAVDITDVTGVLQDIGPDRDVVVYCS